MKHGLVSDGSKGLLSRTYIFYYIVLLVDLYLYYLIHCDSCGSL